MRRPGSRSPAHSRSRPLLAGLGARLDSQWLSSLVAAVGLLAIGAFLVESAVNDIEWRELVPREMMEAVREDVSCTKQEVRELTHDQPVRREAVHARADSRR